MTRRNAVTYALTALAVITPAFSAEAQQRDVKDMLYDRMHYLSFKQDVISGNIANADTPGYISKRVTPFKAHPGNAPAVIRPAVTHPRHIGPDKPAAFREIENPYPAQMKPNGNNISLEQEVTDMNITELEYREATSLVTKLRELHRTAMGEGR